MDDESSAPGSFEYAPLRLPQDIDTVSAQARLAVAAEYGNRELARVQRFSDGTRQVTMRRRRDGRLLPGLSY